MMIRALLLSFMVATLAIGCGGENAAPVDAADPLDAACGLGESCVADADCACSNVCAAKSCVAPAACDEALIRFTTPIENTDGTCLTDLGGFKLYWDTSEALANPTVVDLGLPCVDDMVVPCGMMGMTATQQVCAYRLGGLPEGTIYFAVSTYSTTNVESERSGTVSKSVACP